MLAALTRTAALHASKGAFPHLSSRASAMALRSSSAMMSRGLAVKVDDSPSPIPPAKASSDADIPSIFDQATGLERAEIEYPDIFKHNEVLRGPFGTESNTVKIQSYYDSRIVGCTGHAAPNDHDIVWLQLKLGEKSICPECGQYFELETLKAEDSA